MLGTWDKRTANNQRIMTNQIQQVVKLLHSYSQMLACWSATSFVFLSDDCVGFKVRTSIYNGTVLITWQDNAFYSVQFRDMELKILGICNAEEVLDVVKDYVENREVWV